MFEENTEPQKFTIGDQEYTQDELNALVEKGNRVTEIEKNNGSIDKVLEDWGKSRAELGELRKFKEEAEAKLKANEVPVDLSQMTPEQIRAKAKEELVNLGLIDRDSTPALIRQELEAFELEKETTSLTEELKDMGIEVEPLVILRYMDSADLDSPQEAIQQLYGNQIKVWQEKQLEENKPQSWLTSPSNNAPRKPDNVKVTDSNLVDLFKEAIGANE